MAPMLTASNAASDKTKKVIVNPYLRKDKASNQTSSQQAVRQNFKTDSVKRKSLEEQNGIGTKTKLPSVSSSSPVSIPSTTKTIFNTTPRTKQTQLPVVKAKSKNPKSFRQQLAREIADLKRKKQDEIRLREDQRRQEERKLKTKMIEEERARKAKLQEEERQQKEADRKRKAMQKEQERQKKEQERKLKALEKEQERKRKEQERERILKEKLERQKQMEEERQQKLAAEKIRHDQWVAMQQMQVHLANPYHFNHFSGYPYDITPQSEPMNFLEQQIPVVGPYALPQQHLDDTSCPVNFFARTMEPSFSPPPTAQHSKQHKSCNISLDLCISGTDTENNDQFYSPDAIKCAQESSSARSQSIGIIAQTQNNGTSDDPVHVRTMNDDGRDIQGSHCNDYGEVLQSCATSSFHRTIPNPFAVNLQLLPPETAELYKSESIPVNTGIDTAKQQYSLGISTIEKESSIQNGIQQNPVVTTQLATMPYGVTQSLYGNHQELLEHGDLQQKQLNTSNWQQALQESVLKNISFSAGACCSLPPQHHSGNRIVPYPFMFPSSQGIHKTIRRRRTLTKKVEGAKVLCSPLEPPSPFYKTYATQTITVFLLRGSEDNTFGVNLKTFQQSSLVDPDYHVQLQKKQKELPSLEASKTTSTILEKEITLPSLNSNDTKGDPSIETKGMSDIADLDERTDENKLIDFKPSVPSVVESNLVAVEQLELSLSVQSDDISQKPSSAEIQSKNDPPVSVQNPEKTEVKKAELEPTIAFAEHTTKNDNGVEGKLPTDISLQVKKHRQRRRRVNFMVMMVVDAEKQNQRWLKKADTMELLQPEDIIISIGGRNISGMTFPQACAIFSESSKTRQDTDEISLQVEIARRKPPTVKKNAKKLQLLPNASLADMQNPIPTICDAPTRSNSISSRPSIKAPKKKELTPAPPNNSSIFSTTELAMLADSIMKSIHSSSRLLGQPISDENLMKNTFSFRKVAVLKEYGGLTHRGVPTLQQKWAKLTRSFHADLIRAAKEFWSERLLEECGTSLESLPFTTDAKRSALRQLPRPAKGCRCGSKDHSYMHDPKCTLYSDLRRLVPQDTLKELDYSSDQIYPNHLKEKKSQKAVQAAFKDRLMKMKAATKLEEAEARFVALMEEVQVKECKKAVFAPNLTSIVLSSVFELQREFPIHQDKMQPSLDDEDEDTDTEEFYADSSGKRKNTNGSTSQRNKKKAKRESGINFKYVMKILEYISKTWGHVYREPSHKEYAWRWEVFHGHNLGKIKWEASSKNPRKPNRLTFEHVRFGRVPVAASCENVRERLSVFELAVTIAAERLVSSTLANDVPIGEDNRKDQQQSAGDELHKEEDKGEILAVENNSAGKIVQNQLADIFENKMDEEMPKQMLDVPATQVESYCLAVHWLSPASSGVYDELLAFIKLGVLHVSTDGIPYPAPDWESKVDVIILDDMESVWGTDMDADGRCCIHFEMRDALEEKWVKTDIGWALAEDPDDVIFDSEVLQDWRQAFEGKIEEESNILEGIGRFGL